SRRNHRSLLPSFLVGNVAEKSRNLIPALPFCHVALQAPKPISPNYPKKLETFGEHIRKRRLGLRLLQSDVAQLLLADKTSVFNWENNRTMPQVRHIPKIIDFLGYNPLPAARSFSEKLRAVRRTLGLSQRAMAKRLGIDPGTLQAWESGRRRPSKKLQRIVDRLTSREPGVD